MARYPLNLPTSLKHEAERLASSQGVSLNQFILWAVAEKVGSLSQSLDDPAFPNVTYRRGLGGPRPVIRGTGIGVTTIAVAAGNWGMTPEEIADQWGVSVEQVTGALAFYSAHRAEIDAALDAERAMEEAHA